MSEQLDCHAVMRRLRDYLDGEMTAERIAAIRAHLAVCQRCYPQFDMEGAFLHALAAARREYPRPEAVKSRVVAALRSVGYRG